jgi:anaerobic ribonucleoside-triphosphate reductase activating protein
MESSRYMRVLDIVEGTSVDGPGLRTSVYFSGCPHKCAGCHNPESWDIAKGKEMSIDTIIKIIAENDFNVTFSGGDPLMQIENLAILAKRIKEELNKNIWCFTGYTWEQITANAQFSELLDYVDVIVDGRYEKEKRDISLLFRGSSNQRIIDVKKQTVV